MATRRGTRKSPLLSSDAQGNSTLKSDVVPTRSAHEMLPAPVRPPTRPLVGRDALQGEVRRCIASAPITYVYGLPGLGKTALVRQILGADLSECPSFCVFQSEHRGSADADPEKAVANLFRSMSSLLWRVGAEDSPVESVDRARALVRLAEEIAHREVLVTGAAPQRRAFFWLDDAHELPDELLRSLFLAIEESAQISSWVFTSRARVTDKALVGRTYRVLPLERRPMFELASALSPTAMRAAELEQLIDLSRGSPSLLRAWLAAEQPPGDDALPVDLSDSALRSLAMLGALVRPIQREICAKFVTPHDLATLLRWGLVEDSLGLLRVPPDVVTLAAARLAPLPGDVEVVIELLLALGEDELQLDAFNIACAHNCDALLASVLGRHGRALCARGHAETIRRQLKAYGTVDDASIDDVLRRAALHACTWLPCDADSAGVELPRSATGADWLDLARIQLARGEIDSAAESARQAQTRARALSDEETVVYAAVLEATCVGEFGSPEEALRALDVPVPSAPHLIALLRSSVERWKLLSRDPFDAREGVECARAALASANPHDAALSDAIVTSYLWSDLSTADESEAVNSQLLTDPISPAAQLILLARALVSVERNRSAAAEMVLDRLRPLVRGTGYARAFFVVVEVEVLLARGELELAQHALCRAQATSAEAGHRTLREVLMVTEVRIAIASGAPLPDQEAALSLSLPRRWYAKVRDEWRAHHGHALVHDDVVATSVPEVFSERMACAIRWIAAGDFARGEAAALRAAEFAQRFGRQRMAIEALLTTCDALFLASAWRSLEEMVHSVANVSGDKPGPAADRMFYAALAACGDNPSWTAILASAPRGCRVHRRLHAIEDPSQALDAVDRSVVAKMLIENGLGVHARSTWAWTIHLASGSVILPRGRSVSLANRQLLLRLLLALAEPNGPRTKDELARTVWGIRDYHPIRDDKRLQVAVREIRLLIEDVPGEPTRLLTSSGGYCLASSFLPCPVQVVPPKRDA